MMKQPSQLLALALFTLTLGQVSAAQADEVVVAVAANFLAPLQEISSEFSKETRHTTVITAGATGQLFTQIQNGAPFELMVSADSKTPNKLVDAKLAVAASQFTYARGKLVNKRLDLIIANRVGVAGGGFESDDNAATAYWADGEREFASMSKAQLAGQLLDLISQRLDA